MRRAIGASIAAIGLLAAHSVMAQEVRWKAVSFLPLTVSFGTYFKRWVDELNARGKGVLQVDAVGPEAIPVPEQPNAAKTGVVQMHYGPPTFYTGTMFEGEALSLSHRSVKELRANGAWAYLDKLHREKMNLVLLAGLGDGAKFFIYTTVPANEADTAKPMAGLTLRSVQLYKSFFDSLGARQVSLPPGEVFTALERKIVQGYGWPLWDVKAMGWLGVTKYRYGPGFYNVSVNVLLNLDAWNKLGAPQKKLLDDMARWLDEEWPKWRGAKDAAEEKVQADAGVKYIDLGPAFPKRADDAYWDDLIKKSPQHMTELRRLVSK